mgnify:CR=1 FL=1
MLWRESGAWSKSPKRVDSGGRGVRMRIDVGVDLHKTQMTVYERTGKDEASILAYLYLGRERHSEDFIELFLFLRHLANLFSMSRIGIALDDIEFIEELGEGIALIEVLVMHQLIDIGKINERNKLDKEFS